MADDLHKLEEWIGGIMAGLSAGERRSLSRQIGLALRRSNTMRIRANVEPDGSAMEPRKRRSARFADLKNGRARKKGQMFPRLRMARTMKIDAEPDSVTVGYRGAAAGIATIHHRGLVDRVGRYGGAPRVRYPERRLLGFSGDDEEAILDAVETWMGRRGH